jgi:PAS domain-containing protein
VLPVAIGGLLTFGGNGNADLYMLSLPIAGQLPLMSLITFIGGFSAATAMVIVASVALSIMVSNDIVMPIFLHRKLAGRGGQRDDFAKTLLNIRRSAIFAVLLLGYAYYRSTDSTTGLASIGLLSFAAIAQMAPSLFGGLIWRRANARGAILGLTSGFVIWIYLLFLPSLGGPDYSAVASAVLGFIFPGTTLFTAPDADPLVNATVMSLLVNTGFFVIGSMTRNARPLERIQAGIFVKRQSRSQFATRGWKTRISVGDLKATISRYLGEERMERSFQTYQQNSGRKLEDDQPADMALIHFTEQLLGSAIGSSSARLVLSLILQKVEDASADTAWLLDQASEALQYNQDMLQTALSQMDQGIAVFDSSNHLTIWNRRFRQLLDLPETSGQVGFPLADIVAILSQRGDIPVADVSQTVRHFLTLDKPFAAGARPRRADHRGALQRHARQGDRRHLYRHHPAGRGRHGAEAGERDAGAARRRAHRRTDPRQPRTRRGPCLGRRGQYRQDAVLCRRRPRHPAAAQCRPALFLVAGRAAGAIGKQRHRAQHRFRAGIGREHSGCRA